MLFASITAAAGQWLVLALAAKLGSAEMVGQLALALAIVAPIQTLTDLSLRPAFATDARSEYHFRDYASLRGIGIAIALVAGVAAALWNGSARWVILAVSLQKATESASDLLFGLFQKEGHLQWTGQSIVLRSIASSLVFALTLVTTSSLPAACFSGVLIRLGLLAALDTKRAVPLLANQFTGTRSGSSALLQSSLPLAAGLFLLSFTVNIPRYFLGHRTGVAALGVFAALLYVFQAGAMLVDSIGQAGSVRLAQCHARQDSRAFQMLTLQLLGGAALAALAGIAIAATAGETLLRLIYSSTFASHNGVFLLLSLASLPWYCSSILGYALIARRQMRALFLCQAASFAVTAAAAYWNIGAEIESASYVVIATYTTQCLLYLAALFLRGKRT